MKTKKIWIAALCIGLLAGAGSGRLWAAGKTPATAEDDLHAKLLAEDWKPIAKGVYERQRGPNKFEHLGYGREGLVWTIGELKRDLSSLIKEYQSYPSADLAKVIDHLSVKIADAERDLRNTKSFSEVSKANVVGPSCNICYSATADAYPLSGSSGQGVGAIADAKFNDDCGNTGDTYAYAYARATLNGVTNTVTQEDLQRTGTSVSNHAAATVNGASDCSSFARSYAQSMALGFSYSTSDTNSSCPYTLTISGPATASISGTNCQTLTWSATPNGGLAPFTYAWTIDGTAAGTSSSTSVSQTYCGNNTTHTQTVNVALTVTDSTSQAASNSFTTTISYSAINPTVTVTISGPTSIATLKGVCKSGTWTATATGGTGSYTNYAWTLDGVAVGTNSSSLTQTFCPDYIDHATVRVTVTDSASHTGSASFATSIDVESGGGGTGCGGSPCP